MFTRGMKKMKKSVAGSYRLVGTAILAACVHADIALAQLVKSDAKDATAVADNLTTNTASIGGYLPILAQVVGLYFAYIVAMKLKAHGKPETRQQGQLGEAGWSALAAFILIAIPEFLGVGVISIFGSAGTSGITADTFRQ